MYRRLFGALGNEGVIMIQDHVYFCKKCREFTFIKFEDDSFNSLKCGQCKQPKSLENPILFEKYVEKLCEKLHNKTKDKS